jgi:hydrogenase-4 membrane subunit HyfE
MEKWLDLCGTVILLAALAQTGTRNVRTGVWLFAVQSLALSVAGALAAIKTGAGEILILAGLTLLVKTVVIPVVLVRVLNRSGIEQDAGSLMGRGLSVGAAVVLLFVARRVAFHMGNAVFVGWLPVAVSLALIGLLVMVDRRHAMAQVLGFLTMENGLFLAAMALTYGMPFVVEMGVFLDVLVAALLMAVLVFRMHDAMASMDTRKLRRLRG